MRRWMRNGAWLALAVSLSGQMSTHRDQAARRVGVRLACQCGHCSDTVAGCKMSMCGSSSPARERIARQLAAGMSEERILAGFEREWGAGALRDAPGHLTWIVPYGALASGLAALGLFLSRIYRRRAG